MKAAAAAGCAWLMACAATLPALKSQETVKTELGTFVIHSNQADDADVRLVAEAVRNAVPQLRRWGDFQQVVHIYILDNHQELERASGRTNYPWLRAWARYNEVLIQAPQSWGVFSPTQAEVNVLVLHELTHCLIYQMSGTPQDWASKQVPPWFREGIAAFIARQGYRWPTLDELARFYAAHPDQDPLLAEPELYREQSNFVYAAANHAFVFLRLRYGEDPIRNLLRTMRAGASFPQAFQSAIGISVDSFAREFKRFVRWRGFANAAYRSAFFNAEVGLSSIGGRSLPSIAR